MINFVCQVSSPRRKYCNNYDIQGDCFMAPLHSENYFVLITLFINTILHLYIYTLFIYNEYTASIRLKDRKQQRTLRNCQNHGLSSYEKYHSTCNLKIMIFFFYDILNILYQLFMIVRCNNHKINNLNNLCSTQHSNMFLCTLKRFESIEKVIILCGIRYVSTFPFLKF